MKTILLNFIYFLLFVLLCTDIYAQKEEFQKHDNGLIYTSQTMSRLRHIVDSLNIKFRSCDLNKTYLSFGQAIAHYVKISGNIAQVRQDLDKQISFEDFEKQYTEAFKIKNVPTIKYKSVDYQERTYIVFKGENLSGGYSDYEILLDDTTVFTQKVKGKWFYDVCEKGDCEEAYLEAFYFVSDFEATPLAEKYAKMVQYSNCMIDTNAEIFLTDGGRRGYEYEMAVNENSKVGKFMEMVNMKYKVKPPRFPSFPKKESEESLEKYSKAIATYEQNYLIWDSARLAYLDYHLASKPQFNAMLSEALQEAMDSANSYDDFENYVERYISKEKSLLLKRKRIVIGNCSQDQSPRYHALNIARLSAETANWEIFLRSHLDIMNDRFERATDGSYAWASRKTYIGELEALDINVADLLLGICLRIENPSENHYFGHINRIGRALSESSNPESMEVKMQTMIADDELDIYNRIIIMYLFANYAFYTENEAQKEERVAKLNTAIQKLPKEIASQVSFKED